MEAGWQTLDALFNKPAIQYRRSPNTLPQHLGKVLSTNAPSDSSVAQPALLVQVQAPKNVSPSEIGRAKTAIDIMLTVQSSVIQTDLPPGLRLWLTDETGMTLMEAVNTEERQEVELEFQAETGDRFDIHIQWANTVVTERFMV